VISKKQPAPNPALVQAIGRIIALAKQSQFNEIFIRKHLTLTRLSPTVVHEVLTGQTSKQMGLDDLFKAAKSHLWEKKIVIS